VQILSVTFQLFICSYSDVSYCAAFVTKEID